MADILERILSVKREEIARAKARKPLREVQAEAQAETQACGSPRDFA